MRERYWTFFVEIKYKAYYYQYFQKFYNQINWGISGFLSITTLSCIAIWDIWERYPYIWGALICLSQVIQALFPKLPYNDQLISTRFMISSMDSLILDIEHDWLNIEYMNLSDDKILQLLDKRQRQYSKLIDQFFSGTYLPEKKWCRKQAEKDLCNFFAITYNTKLKEEML